MATFINEKMPKFDIKNIDDSFRRLCKYVESLTEQLAYIFQNLGGDNFNQKDMDSFIANLGATNIVTQTIISNSVVTKSLYAERGDIAQLTVDWLSTSKKVMKYLNADTSDDDFIEIHEQGIELKSASVVKNGTTPATETLTDREGRPLYWQRDITYAEIKDGFPYVNGKQVYMDIEETDYPVRVYTYSATTKMLINFDEVDGVNVPKISMGDVSITDKDVKLGDKSLSKHIANGDIHLTAEQKAALDKLVDGGQEGGGGSFNLFETDETLIFLDGVLGVNTTNEIEGNNILPITSAAVHTTVGNIEVLLKTI